MKDKHPKRPLLKIRFEGTSIHEGRILYDDLSTFVSNVSLAIERIINSIQTGESIKKGRPFKATQILSALEVVSTRKGSFGLALDLRRNGQQFPGWDMGEQAVDILMQGLKSIENEGQLPKEYDQGVMIALREAGRIIDRGIEKVSINSNSMLGSKRALYTQPTREKVISRLRKYEHGYAVVEGRLLMLDVEESKLRCRIRPSTGEPLGCRYDEDLAEQIMKYLRQFVQARGEATYDPTTGVITSLYIKDLEPIEESSATGGTLKPLSSFWKGKTFEELSEEQGVYPVVDLERLSKDWPEDTDFDSFLEAVRSSRN